MLLDGSPLTLEGLVDRLSIGVGDASSAGGLLDSEALLVYEPAEFESLSVVQ